MYWVFSEGWQCLPGKCSVNTGWVMVAVQDASSSWGWMLQVGEFALISLGTSSWVCAVSSFSLLKLFCDEVGVSTFLLPVYTVIRWYRIVPWDAVSGSTIACVTIWQRKETFVEYLLNLEADEACGIGRIDSCTGSRVT